MASHRHTRCSPSLAVPSPVDYNALSLPELYAALSGTGLVRRLLELARDEDLGDTAAPWKGRARPLGVGGGETRTGGGDITTRACIEPSRMAVGGLNARSAGVVAGLAAVPELLAVFAPSLRFEGLVNDGDVLSAGTALGRLRGPLDEMLELERTLLNVVGRLCGVATLTARYVAAIGNSSPARLYDTRKTTPGMRVLEKYAVRCGGGWSHRLGLHDAMLIKDNHLAGVAVGELASVVKRAVARARAAAAPWFVEVEVDTLGQLAALLALEPGILDIVLLDNMDPATLRRAVEMRNKLKSPVQLEASGGVNLHTIAVIAATGVERISVGALTHSAVSLDIGLDILESPRG